MNKRDVGSHYEDIACECLMREAYEIICRNYRSKQGEIDIIAREGACLCFVEVKYRSDLSCGYPSEAVNKKKQMRIRKASEYYMMTNDLYDCEYRYDVIEILGNSYRIIRDSFGG